MLCYVALHTIMCKNQQEKINKKRSTRKDQQEKINKKRSTRII